MRQVLIILGLIFLLNQILAHSPNEVSFSIYEKDTFILVDAEFPWSLRNAVFMFDSTLNKESTFQDIQNSLFLYIQVNLILTDEAGEKLELLKVTDQKGQSHHEEYQITFEKRPIQKIRNTLLFNFSSKQKNFHLLEINGGKTEFVLTKDKPEIAFKSEKPFKYLFYFFGVLIVIFGYLLYQKSKAF